MILDSCFLIDLMTDDEAAAAKLDELLDRRKRTVVPAVSVTEVERGLETAARRRRFRSIVDELTVASYDHKTAKRAADILQTLDGRGESIGASDGMVAATALVHDEPVVTRNVSEFDRVDSLTVTPY